MNVTEVTANYSEKKQLEQFEPVQMSATFTAEVEEGEDPEEVHSKLMQKAKASVGQELHRRVKQYEMDNEVER